MVSCKPLYIVPVLVPDPATTPAGSNIFFCSTDLQCSFIIKCSNAILACYGLMQTAFNSAGASARPGHYSCRPKYFNCRVDLICNFVIYLCNTILVLYCLM